MKKSIKSALAVGAAMSVLLSGCSKDAGDAPPPASESNVSSSSASSAAAEATSSEKAAGTVTIKHAWGEDEYPVNPKKVVAMGAAVDDLLALGVVPDVVVGAKRDNESPWRKDQIQNSKFVEVTNFRELPIEEIANANPDIIVGDFWTVNQEVYGSLKDVAPIIGGIGASPAERGWRPRTEALGKIFDKEAEAAKVIKEHDELFAKTAKDLPGLEGKSGIVAQYAKERGGIGVVIDPEEPGNSFLKELGMKLPDGFATLKDNGSGRSIVSAENISAIDSDFGVIYAVSGTEDEIHAIPGFDDLTQVKNDTLVFGDHVLVQALNNPSALSMKWALEQLRPALEKVSKI